MSEDDNSFELLLVTDLVYVYRIMFGHIATDISDYFTLQSANDYSAITRRGNPCKLLVNHCRIDVRKKNFL